MPCVLTCHSSESARQSFYIGDDYDGCENGWLAVAEPGDSGYLDEHLINNSRPVIRYAPNGNKAFGKSGNIIKIMYMLAHIFIVPMATLLYCTLKARRDGH